MLFETDEEITDINDLKEKMIELMNDQKSGRTRSVKKVTEVKRAEIVQQKEKKQQHSACAEHQIKALGDSICAIIAGSSSSLNEEDAMDPGMKALQQFNCERGQLGAAFGMSGPTLGSIKKDDGKSDEKPMTFKDVNSKVMAGIAGKKVWKNITSSISNAVKAVDGPLGGPRQARYQSLSPRLQIQQIDGKQLNQQIQNLRSQSHDDDEIQKFMSHAQELGMFNIFYNMPKNSIGNVRKTILKRTNDVINENRKKEERLKALYTELGHLQRFEETEKQCKAQLDQKMKQLDNDDDPIAQLYQSKIEQTHMEPRLEDKTFDYSNLYSCIERKEILSRKFELSSQRILQMEQENEIYQGMLKTLNSKKKHDLQQTNLVEEKNISFNKVVEELEEVKQFETQRQYYIEGLRTQYINNLNRDLDKIKKFREEKEMTLMTIEEDSQNILKNIHNNLKQCRELQDDISEIKGKQDQFDYQQKELMTHFMNRQVEVDLLLRYAQLNKIKQYTSEIENIEKVNSNDIDSMRVRGLECVEKLKQGIQNVFQQPNTKAQNIHMIDQCHVLNNNTSLSQDELDDFQGGSPTRLTRHSIRSVADSPTKHTPPSMNSLMLKNQYSPMSGCQSPPPQNPNMAIGPQNSPQENVDIYINNYFNNKEEFDAHYAGYLELAKNLTANEMIQIFSKSVIQCNSLQAAFDDKEESRTKNMKQIKNMQHQLQYLHDEDQEVNEFFKQLNIGQDIPSYSAHINMKYMTQEMEDAIPLDDCFVSCFPASFEGLKAYSENIDLNVKSLYKNQKAADDMLHNFLTGINGFLMLAVRRQNMMSQHTSDIVIYQDDDKTFMTGLYAKYNRSPIKRAVTKKTTQQKKCLALKHKFSSNSRQVGKLQSQRSTIDAKKVKFGKNQDLILANEGSNLHSSLDSLKEEDEYERLSLNSNMSAGTIAKIRKTQSVPLGGSNKKEKDKDDLLNYEDDVNELHRSFVRFIEIFDAQRGKLQQDVQFKGEKRCGKNKSKTMHLQDFDPVYRKKDFAQIKKNITKRLVMEVVKGKHEDQYQRNIKKKEEMAKNVMDEAQHQFIKESKQKKLDIEANQLRIAQKQLRASKQSQNKEADVDEDSQVDSADEVGSCRNKKNKGIQLRNYVSYLQSAANYKNEPKNENTIEKYELYCRKRDIQSVHRTEKYFMDDLKEQMSQKYNSLKSSYIHEVEAGTQRLMKAKAMTIQSPIRPTNGSFGGMNSQSISPMTSNTNVKANGSNSNSLRVAVGKRQSITQGGKRPSRTNENLMNFSQHKRDLQLYNSFISAAGAHDRDMKPDQTKELLSSMGIATSANFAATAGSETSKETFIGNFNKVMSLKDALGGITSTMGQRAGAFQPSKTSTGKIPSADYPSSGQAKGRIFSQANFYSQQYAQQREFLNATLRPEDSKPLKSACFDIDKMDIRAPTSASLHNRLKLNKQITSPIIANLRKHSRQHQSSSLKTRDQMGNYTAKNLMSEQNLLSAGDAPVQYEKAKGKAEITETYVQSELGYNLQRTFSSHANQKKDRKSSAHSPAQQRRLSTRQKTGSIDPKNSWNYQNTAYTSNMAFNVAYNTFNGQKNSFMQIYTNKKQRQEIYQKHLFDKFVSRSKDKDRKLMASTLQAPEKTKYNKNKKKASIDCGSTRSPGKGSGKKEKEDIKFGEQMVKVEDTVN